MRWPFSRQSAQPVGEVRSISATQSSSDLLRVFGVEDYMATAASELVTVDSAMGVPAVLAAVTFLAGTIGGLPLKVYKRGGDAGHKAMTGGLASILHGVANVEASLSAFEVLKWWVEQALTQGRGVLFIERDGTGQVLNLWPLDSNKLTIKRQNGVRTYHYRDGGKLEVYKAAEVLDLPFMLKADGLQHRSPIMASKEVIGMAQAMTKYGAAFFLNGGVPPFAVTGGFKSPGAMARASDDMDAAVAKSAKAGRMALMLPTGLEIKPIGGDPNKNQMIEAQRFMVEQIARIFSMPPVFLQDLTHGTFSNTEQQDLHFVKHTLKRWVEQIEQEMNLKFFGRESDLYVEFAMDGLLRGDFKTRMEGYAQAVQNAILTPNEIAALENRPNRVGGDKLFIQGATIPLDQANANQGAQQ